MTAHIGSGSSYKEIQGGTGGAGTAIGVSGSYKSVNAMWIGSGGAWKQFFAAFTLLTSSISDSDTVTHPDVASASFTLSTDGTGWGTPVTTGIGSNYEARLTKTSGTDPTGFTLNTWLPLSSIRTATLTKSGIGIADFEGDLEIGLVGTSTALVTRGVSLYAEVSI